MSLAGEKSATYRFLRPAPFRKGFGVTAQTLLEQFLRQAERLDIAVFPDRPTPALKEWLDKTRQEWQQTRGQLDPNFILNPGVMYLEPEANHV